MSSAVLVVILLVVGLALLAVTVATVLRSRRPAALQAPPLELPTYCAACGTSQAPGVRYCTRCGQPIALAVPQAVPSTRSTYSLAMPTVFGALAVIALAGGAIMLANRPSDADEKAAATATPERMAVASATATLAPTATALAPVTAVAGATPTAGVAVAGATATAEKTPPLSATPQSTSPPDLVTSARSAISYSFATFAMSSMQDPQSANTRTTTIEGSGTYRDGDLHFTATTDTYAATDQSIYDLYRYRDGIFSQRNGAGWYEDQTGRTGLEIAAVAGLLPARDEMEDQGLDDTGVVPLNRYLATLDRRAFQELIYRAFQSEMEGTADDDATVKALAEGVQGEPVLSVWIGRDDSLIYQIDGSWHSEMALPNDSSGKVQWFDFSINATYQDYNDQSITIGELPPELVAGSISPQSTPAVDQPGINQTDLNEFVVDLETALQNRDWAAVSAVVPASGAMLGYYRSEGFPLSHDDFVGSISHDIITDESYPILHDGIPQGLAQNVTPPEGTEAMVYASGLGDTTDDGLILISSDNGVLYWSGLIYIEAAAQDY